MSQKASGTIRVRLVRSMSNRLESHKACVRGLGIRRMHHEVEVADTPANRGMINRVRYMLEVQEAK
jgi:large subunit ribosomal protein L30